MNRILAALSLLVVATLFVVLPIAWFSALALCASVLFFAFMSLHYRESRDYWYSEHFACGTNLASTEAELAEMEVERDLERQRHNETRTRYAEQGTQFRIVSAELARYKQSTTLAKLIEFPGQVPPQREGGDAS